MSKVVLIVAGLALLKHVRETESTREAQVHEALDLGAQSYIRKPCTPDQGIHHPLFA